MAELPLKQCTCHRRRRYRQQRGLSSRSARDDRHPRDRSGSRRVALSSSELNAGRRARDVSSADQHRDVQAQIEFFAQHRHEIGLSRRGLSLAEDSGAAGGLASVRRSFSVARVGRSKLGTSPSFAERVPFIDKTDDLAGALFAPSDGLGQSEPREEFLPRPRRASSAWFSKTALCVRGIEEVSPTEAEVRCKRSRGSRTRKSPLLLGQDGSAQEKIALPRRDRGQLRGSLGGSVARALGYDSPAYPLRRQVSIFDCRDVDLISLRNDRRYLGSLFSSRGDERARGLRGQGREAAG